MSKGIIHFTTVHPRTDTRIRLKQVTSISLALKKPIALFVSDGKGNELDYATGVEIIDIGLPLGGRKVRMTKGAWMMFLAVLKARPSLAHFHDPELIPVGIALKICGIKVIYDVHEDVPRQILSKFWVYSWLRHPIALVVELVEWFAAYIFDGIVTATHTISARFPTQKTLTVQNFPIVNELVLARINPFTQRSPHVAYIGGITLARGAIEMVQAQELVTVKDVRLELGGTFSPANLENKVKALPGWSRVIQHGWVDRRAIATILGDVQAGLVVLHPIRNYPDALPVKMFEYMASGLPVIASDFPIWRQIIENASCGLLVDPCDPNAIAQAIDWILKHPNEAEAMGHRGREAVQKKYNWELESQKLIKFYKLLLAD